MIKPNQSRVLCGETLHVEHAQPQGSPGRATDRLLCAAVVNPTFRTLLLNNPSRALAVGYQGDSFDLSEEEVKLLQSIKAESLQEFAERLLVQEYVGAEAVASSPEDAQTAERHSAKIRVRL